MRFLTAGESHGPALVTLVEGFPAGVPLPAEAIDRELGRRQGGYGRGQRQKIESDRVRFLGGVRNGFTTGAPLSMLLENRDHANWLLAMDPAPIAPGDAERLQAIAAKRITRLRPGHADYAGAVKYGHTDVRDVLERASARETAARVMAGAAAGALLAELGIRVGSHVVSIGEVAAEAGRLDSMEPMARVDAGEGSVVRCADPEASRRMTELIDRTRSAGDTLGGIVEVVATGVPVGLGSHVHWDRRLDGRLAQALMSVHAVKGVEVGLGFESARTPGSAVHDPFLPGFERPSNRAGGIEGGMSNGETIVLRAAMKPIPTLIHPLPSVDLETGEPVDAHFERSDVCAVSACGVVLEAMARWVLAEAVMEKYGGDSLSELRLRVGGGYEEEILP